MEVETVARNHLRMNYGNMVQLGDYSFEEEPCLHRFRLTSNYPFMIRNDEDSEEIKVRILKMERLGFIFIDENLHVDLSLSTNRDAVDKTIKDTLSHWRNRIEQVVASATSSNLAKLTDLRKFFTPVEGIILFIQDEGFITTSEIMKLDRDREEKYMRYVNLLEGLNLLERNNGGWKESIELDGLLKGTKTIHEMVTRVIGVLVGKRYITLKKEFKLMGLEAPIRLQNVVYLPELEVEHNLLRKRKTLAREYYYHYRRKMIDIDLVRNLRNLVEVDALKQEKRIRRYSGQEELLQQMIKARSDLPPLHKLSSSRA